METLIGTVLAVLFVIAVALGAYWLLWTLWCWVLPQVWIAGPENIIHPNFWLFAAAWFLLTLFGRAVFGRSEK